MAAQNFKKEDWGNGDNKNLAKIGTKISKRVKSMKMYKKSTQILLNYKFKKITFKNFQIHGLSDCLAKRVKILDGVKCSPLLAPIPLDTCKFEMQLSSGIIIMLLLLSHEVHIMLNKSI